MKLLTLLYVFCLFYVFIPGNIIKLPIKTSKLNITLIHGLLFSTILYYTLSMIEGNRFLEGMDNHTCDEHHIEKCMDRESCVKANGYWDGEVCKRKQISDEEDN